MADLEECKDDRPDFKKPSTIYNCNPQVKGMPEMLDICGLKLEGKHHSGIDDSKNIASVAMHLMSKGFKFTQGMVLKRN